MWCVSPGRQRPGSTEGGGKVASTLFYTLEACHQQAIERQTAYANSVAHLFKVPLVPTTSTTKAELTAAEADFDDYATKTFVAWNAPILAPGSGFEIVSPLVQWTCAADQVVGNDIGGGWMEDAGGVVRMVWVYDTPLPMQLAFQGIPLSLIDFFPTGV